MAIHPSSEAQTRELIRIRDLSWVRNRMTSHLRVPSSRRGTENLQKLR